MESIPNQQQLESILDSMRKLPYDSAEGSLAAQLKAIDEWERQVTDQPALAAIASVLRAQAQASQRMLDVTRRESEQVAEAMQRAARALAPGS